ncbi:MAG: tyrosine-type recombinase/integrase [Nitrososphaeraceae archaeon]
MEIESILLSNNRAYFNFINSISSEHTKQAYKQNLTRFMRFCKLDSVDELLKIDMQKTIIDYVVSLREANISHSTIHVLLAPIYHFCEMNDIFLNKKKIRKYKGERMRVVKDRAYTHEEISKLLNTSNIRMKPIILLMASSGVRVGSIPALRLKHIQKLDDIYRITVYENTASEYFTFCTAECSKAIDDYLGYRKRKTIRIDPDHFTVFELKEGWEKEASKYCSQEAIEAFKERQELLKTIPEPIRIRTKEDKSYREGWVDAAGWIQTKMNEIFHKNESSRI